MRLLATAIRASDRFSYISPRLHYTSTSRNGAVFAMLMVRGSQEPRPSRAILATMYGGGLRVSEVSNLKVCDIDGARKVIWIRGGKGNKDRQVMLSAPLREVLAAYFRWKRPTD